MKAFDTIMAAEFPEYFSVQGPTVIYIRDDAGYLVDSFLVRTDHEARQMLEALPDGWIAGTE